MANIFDGLTLAQLLERRRLNGARGIHTSAALHKEIRERQQAEACAAHFAQRQAEEVELAAGRLALADLPVHVPNDPNGVLIQPRWSAMQHTVASNGWLVRIGSEVLMVNQPGERARLIAAAPELLAELRRVRSVLLGSEVEREAVARIDALLAKIGGAK